MRLIFNFLLLSLLLLFVTFISMVLLAVDDNPMLQGSAELTAAQIARGKMVFEQNDPRRLKPGSIASARLDQAELNLAINYFANQYSGALAGLEIQKNQALLKATFPLPSNFAGRYLNLLVEFKQNGQLPVIEFINIGKLRIPAALVSLMLKAFLEQETELAAKWAANWQTIVGMIRKIDFDDGRMIVWYRWQNDMPAKLSHVLVSVAEQQRLQVYQQHLTELTAGGKKSFELVELLQPLFKLAGERSPGDEAVSENRALILVASFYVNSLGLDKIIPAAKAWTYPVWRPVTVEGRDDFPKHFLVSAMLAAYAGTPMANAVGVFKEVDDAHGGSGFSFNDIAADRAGALMGELAVANDKSAKKVQSLMAVAKQRDFMPEISDLPEFMSAAEFQRRFGGVEGEPYRKMMEEIGWRISSLRLNQ